MNRSSVDIVASILDVSKEGAAKTRIMYGALISFSQFEQYLELLSNTDLISGSPDGKYYTTGKGLHFLKVYESVGHMMVPADEVHRTGETSQVQELLDEVAGRL